METETRSRSLAPLEPATIDSALALADTICKSKLVPDHIRSSADCLLIMLTSRSLGLPAMAGLRGMHVVKGKVGLSADLLVALAKQHPDCAYFRLVESTDKIARYECQRRGDPSPTTLTYTIEQAKRAGLLSNDVWNKHTEAMLRARCSSSLVRIVFPDVFSGVYEDDEIREIQDRETAGKTGCAAERTPPQTFAAVDAEVMDAQPAADLPPKKSAPTPTKPAGPPMTADQKAQLAALKKVLGPEATGAIMRKLGLGKDIDSDAAAMLIDTLTSEAEARAAAQPAPKQEAPAPAVSQSPGDMAAPPAGDLWPAGRE